MISQLPLNCTLAQFALFLFSESIDCWNALKALLGDVNKVLLKKFQKRFCVESIMQQAILFLFILSILVS